MLQMEDNIRPPISPADASAIARQRYDIAPTAIRALPSELDRNYHLRAPSGEEFILKIAHSSVADAALDLQNKTLRHLRKSMDIAPELIPATNGDEAIGIRAANGDQYRARLLRYIEGIPLSDFRPHSEGLLEDIGTQLGAISAALQNFRHAEKRPRYRWNIGCLSDVAPYAADLPPAEEITSRRLPAPL